MTAWVLAGARSQPVVLAFEDLHWADPTSLDLMQALAERGAQAPLLDRRDHAAGIPPALGHALAPQRHFARAARPRAGAPHGRRDRQRAMRSPTR